MYVLSHVLMKKKRETESGPKERKIVSMRLVRGVCHSRREGMCQLQLSAGSSSLAQLPLMPEKVSCLRRLSLLTCFPSIFRFSFIVSLNRKEKSFHHIASYNKRQLSEAQNQIKIEKACDEMKFLFAIDFCYHHRRAFRSFPFDRASR